MDTICWLTIKRPSPYGTRHPVLRRGDYTTVYAEAMCWPFVARLEGVNRARLLQRGRRAADRTLQGMGGTYEDTWGQVGRVSGETALDLTIPARDAAILVTAV